MEELAKNLWLLLTLVIPGMTTYGTFRLLVLLRGSSFDKSLFTAVDGSAVLTACVITALALGQQAVAIVLEAIASALCHAFSQKRGRYYALFCERFKMAARGQLNDNATRVVGSLFTSLNVTIGQGLILAYLLWYEERRLEDSAVRLIAVFVGAGLISTIFRLTNAASIVDQVGNEPHLLRSNAAGSDG